MQRSWRSEASSTNRICELSKSGEAFSSSRSSTALEGFFQNFGQYKTTTWIGSSHALSIVLPKGSIIVNEYAIRQPLLDIAF
jgi:hypothetical protein